MEPYYQDDSCTIYHGDCLDVLPTITGVDIVVTSPPYNTIPTITAGGMLSEHNHKQFKGYLSYGDDMSEESYQGWLQGVLGRCFDLCRGLMWVNHKTRYRDREAVHPLRFLPYPIYSEIIWDRGVSITLNAKKFAPSHEFIIGFGVPHFWDRTNDMSMSVWRINPERGIKGHPCPYPILIPTRLISSSCPVGGVVLDPFMGSGTTLEAAKQLGRKAIGIELEEKYCEIAAERLQQEYMQF